MSPGQLSRKRVTDEAEFDIQDRQNGDHLDRVNYDNNHKRTKTCHSNKSTILSTTTTSSTGPSLIRHSSSAMSIDDFDMMSDTSAAAYSQAQSFTFSPVLPSVSTLVAPQNNLDFNIDDDDPLDLDDVADDKQALHDDRLLSTTPTTAYDRASTPGAIMKEMGRLELEVGSDQLRSQRSTVADRERVVHAMLQPVGLSPNGQSGIGRLAKRFTMGYRLDCEKCRLKVPGHWAHPPGIS